MLTSSCQSAVVSWFIKASTDEKLFMASDTADTFTVVAWLAALSLVYMTVSAPGDMGS